jgi:hypothetical protein
MQALYCKDHKRPDDVNVVNKRCMHEGCDEQPSGSSEDGRAEYRGSHRRPDDMDVVSKRCLHEGCDKQPAVFGSPDDGQVLFCVL